MVDKKKFYVRAYFFFFIHGRFDFFFLLVELETDTKISHCYILTNITYTQNDYYWHQNYHLILQGLVLISKNWCPGCAGEYPNLLLFRLKELQLKAV